ncbi:MAG: thiamine-phosphate kinase [Bacteroidetes bacterium]|nr:thiamine-phosphate kinase [Bacteroidota bacterium]MBP6426378.1 thiamine-phosphate kinase [Bacteroidia bacterium]MBK8365405.1 thiamine-phosphate kinase [Bacteroidota bacterium]MBK9414554.1 thiamine-phosphate kinase [Bacteroidota bacterium]MBL0033107.1 thiamine-phosphate kinase [Bacteroidota bacterium]
MFENKENRTELSSLGEFGLIDQIASAVELKNPESVRGIGDDAAVIDNGDEMTVVTTDMLVEGVHFDLTFQPLKHLGYKAVTVNLSDIYAMNATPKQIVVGIAISNRFSLEAIEELYEGIQMACDKYSVDLVGGDTTSSTSGLVISITAIGKAKREDIVYRNGAGVGDLICVSGDLGGAYVGLQLLEREKKIFLENPKIQPDLSNADYILERQLKPEPRKDIIDKLKQVDVKPTAMIDISDGLSSEVMHLCKQSQTGCTLYEDKFPIDPQTYEKAREFNLDPTVCALSGGEDYELLFTIKQSDYEKMRMHVDISIVGHMVAKEEGLHLIDKSGNQVKLQAQGWKAF